MKENWLNKGREYYWEILENSFSEFRTEIESADRYKHRSPFSLRKREEWNEIVPIIISNFDTIGNYIKGRQYNEVLEFYDTIYHELSKFDLSLDGLWLKMKRALSGLESKDEVLLYKEKEKLLLPPTIYPVSDRLLQILAKNPTLLRDIDPRKFEEVICELFKRDGCDVLLTNTTRDHGADIIVIARISGFPIKMAVQCKRYNDQNHVGVSVVRDVVGACPKFSANKGLIITTSSFTRDAIQLSRSKEYVMKVGLMDYEGIKEWLKRYT